MQRSYRAAVMPGPGLPIEVREIPAPTLEPGAALLETIYSEVCGTDVHLHHGRLAGVPYPIVPGHVSVGRLAKIRGRIDDVDGRALGEGDLVAFLDVVGTCGACRACLVDKAATRCPSRRVYGITLSARDGLLGGWAEAIWLMPGTRVLRLPPELPPEVYIAGGCGLQTAIHAVDRAGIRLGDVVVVLGAGPVGQSAVAFAALSGATEIIAVGAPAARLEMARRMGATQVLDIESLPFAERLAAVRARSHGRGADVVIEAAGAPRAVVEGAELCRDGGVLVVAGQYTDNGPVEWNVHELLNKKHLDVRGCWGSDFSHFERAISLLARHHHRVPWRDLVSRHYSLEKANEALGQVERREVLKALIVPA